MCRHNGRCRDCDQDLDPVPDGKGPVREMTEKTDMWRWVMRRRVPRRWVLCFLFDPKFTGSKALVSTQKTAAIVSGEKKNALIHTHTHKMYPTCRAGTVGSTLQTRKSRPREAKWPSTKNEGQTGDKNPAVLVACSLFLPLPAVFVRWLADAAFLVLGTVMCLASSLHPQPSKSIFSQVVQKSAFISFLSFS